MGALLVAFATPSFAQWTEVKQSESDAMFSAFLKDSTPNRAKTISITPFVGSYMLPSNQNLNSRPILGLRGGYNFNENFTAEAVVSYGLGRDRDARETNSVRYGVDLLYHFLLPEHLNKFVPFLAIGAGGNYLTTPDTPGTPAIGSKNFATVNAGGGLKYFIADDIALRGDIRQVTSFENSTRMNVEYSAGVTFNFGGVKKPIPPVPACAEAEPKTVIVEKIVEVPKYIDREVEKPVTVYVEKKTVVSAPVEPKPVQIENTAVKSVAALAVEKKLKVLTGTSFKINSNLLTPAGKKAFAANVAILKQLPPEAKILIAGHSSASGSDDLNQRLSESRANAVRDLLVKAGINKKQISTVGYGSTKPAIVEVDAHNTKSPAAIANRRVVIEVSGF